MNRPGSKKPRPAVSSPRFGSTLGRPLRLLVVSTHAAEADVLARRIESAVPMTNIVSAVAAEASPGSADAVIVARAPQHSLELGLLTRFARLAPATPIVIVGEEMAPAERAATTLAGASGYLLVSELERLPALIREIGRPARSMLMAPNSRLSQLEDAHRMAIAFGGELRLEEVCRVAVDSLIKLLGVDRGAVLAWSPAERALKRVFEAPDRLIGGSLIRPGQGPSGAAFARRQSVVVHDDDGAQLGLEPMRDGGYRSALAVPLIHDGRPIGVLTLGSRHERFFSDHALELVSVFAAELAPRLFAARLHQRVERDAEELRFIAELTQFALRAGSPDELLDLAMRGVRRILSTEFAMILEVSPDQSQLVVRSGVGWRAGTIGHSISTTSEGAGRSIFVTSSRAITFVDAARARSFRAHPLFAEQGVVGGAVQPIWIEGVPRFLMTVQSTQRRRFSTGELRFLRTVAQLAGESIHRHEVQMALAASEARLSAVMNNAPAVIVGADTEGRLFFVDGRPVREPTARNDQVARESINADLIDNREFNQAIKRALAGEIVEFSHHSTASDRDWETRFSVIEGGNDQAVGLIAVAIDVTERYAAEVARREATARTKFLSSMSHELRTPLNSILGFAQLLADPSVGELNPRQQRYLSHIQGSGAHLLSLISDLLDLSRISAGQIRLEIRPTSVTEAVSAALESVRPMADSRAQVLSSAGLARHQVSADPVRLRQILLNLLSNALKFTPEGGHIRLRARARPGTGTVSIEVSDTGIGIPSEALESIFDEFVQLSSPEAEIQGSGLGLAVSRQLARAMGGDVTAKNRAGGGSIFTIVLPAA
ncbi:MAG TPA: ATP-binding protein [Candidatus Nitrosotalea sp.]|nr:ATP-binding protein [Candidatus Nitrosotalea sp.]